MNDIMPHAVTTLATSVIWSAGILIKIMFSKNGNGHVKREDLQHLRDVNSKEHADIHERITEVSNGVARIDGYLKAKN